MYDTGNYGVANESRRACDSLRTIDMVTALQPCWRRAAGTTVTALVVSSPSSLSIGGAIGADDVQFWLTQDVGAAKLTPNVSGTFVPPLADPVAAVDTPPG